MRTHFVSFFDERKKLINALAQKNRSSKRRPHVPALRRERELSFFVCPTLQRLLLFSAAIFFLATNSLCSGVCLLWNSIIQENTTLIMSGSFSTFTRTTQTTTCFCCAILFPVFFFFFFETVEANWTGRREKKERFEIFNIITIVGGKSG